MDLMDVAGLIISAPLGLFIVVMLFVALYLMFYNEW